MRNMENDTLSIIPKSSPYRVNFPPVSKKFIREKTPLIEHFYDEYLKDNIWGGFLVAKNGEIIYEKYQGYSNLAEKKLITSKTPMHVASIGKVYVAITVLRLVDKKLINLDALVSDYIEGFPYEGITVRMLLSHRSGLPKYEAFADRLHIWKSSQVMTNKDVVNLLCTKKPKLNQPTNTQFAYCNTNFVLLAEIVERVTKKPLNEVMKILLYEPLGMKDTFVLDALSIKYQVTQSYYKNNKIMRWDYLDGTYGDKNIYTTPRDLLKLDAAIYSDKFLSKDIKKQIYKGYSKVPAGKSNYGLGIRIIEPVYANDDAYTFHNGWWRGNKTSYVTMRKDSLTIICFDNRNTGKAYKTKHLAKYFGNFSFIDDED